FYVEVVGRFVQQQYVSTLLQGVRQLQTATLTTGQLAHALLLIATFEVKAADVGAAGVVFAIDVDHVHAVGNGFPHGFLVVQLIAQLFHKGQFHGFTDHHRTGIRLLSTGNHAEQGRFTGTVTADNADDGARRYGEAQVVDQHAVAVGFGDVMELDHLVAQTRAWRNVDLVGFVTGLELAGV